MSEKYPVNFKAPVAMLARRRMTLWEVFQRRLSQVADEVDNNNNDRQRQEETFDLSPPPDCPDNVETVFSINRSWTSRQHSCHGDELVDTGPRGDVERGLGAIDERPDRDTTAATELLISLLPVTPAFSEKF